MVQQVIVFALVAACGVWLAWQGYRFFKPRARAGGSAGGCGAGCCDGKESPAPQNSARGGERVVMIRSDDLRARVAARR